MLALAGCSGVLYQGDHRFYLDPEKIGVHPDPVWFATEDGYRLSGWYFHQKQLGREGQPPRAVIVFFHGNGQNLTSHFATLLFVLEQGYDFFIFDYRGYGLSDGSPTPKGTIEDGKAAIRWVQMQNEIDGRPDLPIVVFGQSLGGAVALRTVAEVRERFPAIRKVIVDSTFHSYRAAGRDVLSRHWLTWPFQPLACVLLSDEYAPDDLIARIAPVPLVVIHGTADQVIDESLGKKVYALAGEPKEFIEVPGARHTQALWMKDGKYREKFLEELPR